MIEHQNSTVMIEVNEIPEGCLLFTDYLVKRYCPITNGIEIENHFNTIIISPTDEYSHFNTVPNNYQMFISWENWLPATVRYEPIYDKRTYKQRERERLA